jgi:nucleotide-binding universal stress UspA family protein
MYRRILVPLDGSKVGEAALSVVEALATDMKPEVETEVILFRALPPTHWIIAGEVGAPVRFTDEEQQILIKAALEYLNTAGEKLRAAGIAFRTIAVIGNNADEIIKAAKENSVNLIAMSTHGRSGLRRWAFGSVTEKVLRESPVPVMTVRADESVKNE